MWSPRWRKAAAEDAAADGKAFNSLFGEILDWMLAPLLFLWPISIIVTHNVADSIANQPYDLALADGVRALARLVEVEDEQIVVRFPAPPRALFRADQDDVVYFQADQKYTTVVTADGEALLRTSLRELLPRLDPNTFKQIHRSTIVNLKAIAGIVRDDSGRGTVRLKQRPETLTVSQPFMALFKHM